MARRSGRQETPACLGVRDLESGALLMLEASPAIETSRHTSAPRATAAPIAAVCEAPFSAAAAPLGVAAAVLALLLA